MIKGTTKSGFKYMLREDKLDDYELFEMLCEIDLGKKELMPRMSIRLLGEKQMNRLKEHLRDKNGTVSTTMVANEVTEILNGSKALKNS